MKGQHLFFLYFMSRPSCVAVDFRLLYLNISKCLSYLTSSWQEVLVTKCKTMLHFSFSTRRNNSYKIFKHLHHDNFYFQTCLFASLTFLPFLKLNKCWHVNKDNCNWLRGLLFVLQHVCDIIVEKVKKHIQHVGY